MADDVEEQAVGEGAAVPLKVDPNLEYRVTRFRLACGKAMDELGPQSLGLEGSGRVRYRGHATMGGQIHIEFEIVADSRAEAWEKFDGRAVEEANKIVENAKAAALRANWPRGRRSASSASSGWAGDSAGGGAGTGDERGSIVTIKVGDVVRCERVQGQKMTVDFLLPSTIYHIPSGEWCGKPACICKWFPREGDGWGELQEAEFHLDELRVVEPEESTVGEDKI